MIRENPSVPLLTPIFTMDIQRALRTQQVAYRHPQWLTIEWKISDKCTDKPTDKHD